MAGDAIVPKGLGDFLRSVPYEITGQWFHQKNIKLDGYAFSRCRFDSCSLFVSRGLFRLEHCYMENCVVYYLDEARTVVRLFSGLHVPPGAVPLQQAVRPIFHSDGTFSVERHTLNAMPPKSPNLSLSAAIKAQISGVSRGTDLSLLVLAVVSLLGVVGCFWLSIWVPWALAGAVVFLVGFGFVLYVWKRGIAARFQTEAPPAQFNWKSGTDELALSIPLDQGNYVVKRMLAGMRSLVQTRELPPIPRGAVESNAADKASLREYSLDEQQTLERRWAKEIPRHDELVVGQLESTLQSLGAATPELQPKADEKGLRQLPDVNSPATLEPKVNEHGLPQLPDVNNSATPPKK